MDRSNLIVNYLPSGFDEKDLDEMFCSYGSILSIKIVRDKSTGISMGFGFVNFETNADAQAALTALNGTKLREDKIMKVSVARPAWKANIHSNLYVAGFPPAFSESDVMDLLGVYATSAENVRLLRDPNKNPRGAAVVRMSSEESATGLISALNGVPLRGVPGGTPIQVRPWRPEFRPDRISDTDIAKSLRGDTRSFGNNMNNSKGQSKHRTYTGEKPSSFRQPAGAYKSEDATALLQKMSSNRKGSDKENRIEQQPAVVKAPIIYLDTIDNDGSVTDEYVEDARDVPPEQLFVLFIYHLPSSVSEEYLMDLFSQYGGQIESVRVMQGKGYGFISYFEERDAVYAMTKLNGHTIGGSARGIEIELKTEVI